MMRLRFPAPALAVVVAASLCALAPADRAWAADAPLPHVLVASTDVSHRVAYDGVVEAVRQTVLGSQVAGVILTLEIKAGDTVQAGQIVARIDARTAEQNSAASDAQVQAARASLEVATRDLDRQRQLFTKRYISEAALERAEAQFKSTQAQVNAQIAQASAARAQTGHYTVRAPYSGVIAEVPVAVGDMAMPGRPIATIYEPRTLRVAASIPMTALPETLTPSDVQIEITVTGSNPPTRIEPIRVTSLPTADANAHTVTLRLDLPPGAAARPGTFARVWIARTRQGNDAHFSVPASAVVRRAELTAVYVLDAADRPLLRQVRLGRSTGDHVEVLAGISAGDRVVTVPQRAARATGSQL